jgi:hypothetical protein
MRRRNPICRKSSATKKEVDELKAQRKASQRHIAYKDLPADARFDRLSTQSKHLVDTIKMIAYRAETAMAQPDDEPP